MNRTAVQFGAGNIGRGFIAQLFHESGLEVAFADVAPEIVSALNARRSYLIHIVGPGAAEALITDVRALDGRNRDEVAEAVAGCEIACTAVGAGALKHVAPNLAAGLALRHRHGGGPLNVLVCENLHDASGMLRELVSEHLPAGEREEILAQTGFVQAVVSRMVPLQTAADNGGDPLAIRVEAYKQLPVDGSAIVEPMPEIVGIEPVPNFEAHVERKLYTHNCGHATLGYLGYVQGFKYGYEALVEPAIRGVLDEVLEDTSAALARKHGFDPQEQAAHVADLIERFGNTALGDTCFRLGRDPIRKLAPDDRLVGAARLCQSQGIHPTGLAVAIAAALDFDAPDDPSAVELQRRIESEGVDVVLRDVCGIDPHEPLAAYIKGIREYVREP